VTSEIIAAIITGSATVLAALIGCVTVFAGRAESKQKRKSASVGARGASSSKKRKPASPRKDR